MVTELTPETYFDAIAVDKQMHIVMHYGVTCGPCKSTMPHYEAVANHFVQYGRGDRVKFYRFHQWQAEYKPFIEEHNLKVSGVPTFKFYYAGELIDEVTASYNDPNVLKKRFIDVSVAINSTIGDFDLA